MFVWRRRRPSAGDAFTQKRTILTVPPFFVSFSLHFFSFFSFLCWHLRWSERPNKIGRSRNWPKSKLAEVEIGRNRNWPKSKLAEVELAELEKKKLAEVEIGRSRPRPAITHWPFWFERWLVATLHQECQECANQKQWEQTAVHFHEKLVWTFGFPHCCFVLCWELVLGRQAQGQWMYLCHLLQGRELRAFRPTEAQIVFKISWSSSDLHWRTAMLGLLCQNGQSISKGIPSSLHRATKSWHLVLISNTNLADREPVSQWILTGLS